MGSEQDMQVLRAMAEATLRHTGRCLVMRIRASGESWANLPPLAYDGAPTIVSTAYVGAVAAAASSPKHARAAARQMKLELDLERDAPSTATSVIKETFFDVDDSAPPRTVSTTATPAASPLPGGDGKAGGGPLIIHQPLELDGVSSLDDMEDPYEEQTNAEEEGPQKSDCIWWLDADHPIARFFELATMVVIIISIFGFVLETIPEYRLDENGEERTDNHPVFFVMESCCIAWFTVEYCMRLYAAKGWRWKWSRQPLNVVDLVAILPYYIALGLDNSGASSVAVIRVLRLTRVTRLFKFSRHSQGLRVRRWREGRGGKRGEGGRGGRGKRKREKEDQNSARAHARLPACDPLFAHQDMIVCVTQTRNELVLFFFIIGVASVLFGSAIFYCEKDTENSLFISIPGVCSDEGAARDSGGGARHSAFHTAPGAAARAQGPTSPSRLLPSPLFLPFPPPLTLPRSESMWWAVITMTTVGYGKRAAYASAGKEPCSIGSPAHAPA